MAPLKLFKPLVHDPVALAADGSVVFYSLFLCFPLFLGFCVRSLFPFVVLCIRSSFAIISLGKR